jgi:hypothetical protein
MTPQQYAQAISEGAGMDITMNKKINKDLGFIVKTAQQEIQRLHEAINIDRGDTLWDDLPENKKRMRLSAINAQNAIDLLVEELAGPEIIRKEPDVL